MDIILDSVTAASERALRHMFVAYFYDLSQYDDNLVINAHGLPTWAPAGLPGPSSWDECVQFNWWIRDCCERYLIRADGQPAGFVILLADPAHLPEGVDYELLDFYVAPKYRRQGVGRRAALASFGLHRGSWLVYQLPRNRVAQQFWHTVIGEYTGGQFTMLDDGAQQRFVSPA